MPNEKTPQGPADPFRKLIPKVGPDMVGITAGQIVEFGTDSLVEKFGDFAKKQPALAYKLLKEAERLPNKDEIMRIALMIYYSVEGQMQTNVTRQSFPEKKE